MKYTYTPKITHTPSIKVDKSIFETYKFHPSSVAVLLTDPKSGDGLSKSAESYLDEIYIEEVFGRKKEISNKYIDKGNACENEGFIFATRHYTNNTKYLDPSDRRTLSNDFVVGTPDIILEDKVVDLKGSWDIFSFSSADGFNDQYYIQLQCYMWLLGLKKADLFYYLSNTPSFMIENEKNRMFYKFGANDDDPEYQKWLESFLKMSIYDDLEFKDRYKIFSYAFDIDIIEKLKNRIEKSREYLLNK